MKFRITYYGGIPNWNKQGKTVMTISERHILFTKGNIFTSDTYALSFQSIHQLRFKSKDEIDYRKPLNRYIIGNYIFKSRLLGLIGLNSGLQKHEAGHFRIFYYHNRYEQILNFRCDNKASALFNILLQKIRT